MFNFKSEREEIIHKILMVTLYNKSFTYTTVQKFWGNKKL